MKNRKLFYKDINGLRFLGVFFIFAYIITFMLSDPTEVSVYSQMLPLADALKNQSISLFFVVSSFLLTAHGLRSYKYTDSFHLKNFYMRRIIRIAPIFLLVLLFYFIIHPHLSELLQTSPIEGGHFFNDLLYFPSLYRTIDKNVVIYLFGIYAVVVLAQYYFFWGLVLKFLKPVLPWVLLVLFIVGLGFKISAYHVELPLFLYLPFYLPEITIGAYTAHLLRNKSKVIEKITGLLGSQLFYIYFGVTSFSVIAYLLNGPPLLMVFAKLTIYALISFYIIEQTYSRHSFFKARNSVFMTDLGKISYGYTMFAPVMAIMMLMTTELIEFNIGAKIIQLSFPVVCFLLTWLFSSLYYYFIEKHFTALKKQFK